MRGKTIGELAPGQSASYTQTITAQDVEAYARLVGDTNAVHLDDEAAAQSVFGRRVAHGMLTAGLISTVLGTRLPGEGAIYVGQDLRFRAPVFLGDTITATITVAEVDTERNRCRLDTVCTNQAGTAVITGSALMMPPKDEK